MNLYGADELVNKVVVVPGHFEPMIPYWEDYRWWLPINRDEPTALDEYIDKLVVVDRPGIWSVPGAYPEWLHSLNAFDYERIVHEEASTISGRNEFVWSRAHKNMWCTYPGGYMKAFRHPPLYTRGTRHRNVEQMSQYFLCFHDRDDWVMTAGVETQEESDEIWKYISTVPDLAFDDLVLLGFTA